MKSLIRFVLFCFVLSTTPILPVNAQTTTRTAVTYMGVYSPTMVYNKSEIVLLGNVNYISLVPMNRGNLPSTSPAFWTIIGTGQKPSSVSVMDPPYNAVCDGTTDDHAAIQAALNASPSVTIPSGVSCSIGTTGIALNTGQYLNGNSSNLNYFGSGTAISNASLSGGYNNAGIIQIENLNLNMNETTPGAIGIGLTDSYTVTLQNVEVYGTQPTYVPEVSIGIFGVNVGSSAIILNNVATNDRIVVQGTVVGQNTDVVFNSVFVVSGGTDGIDISYSDLNVLTGVVASGSVCALCLHDTTATTIIGASVSGTTGAGIQMGANVYELNAIVDMSHFTGVPITGTSQGGTITLGDATYLNNMQVTGLLTVNSVPVCEQDGTNCPATFPSVAPSGACSTVGWAFSGDGHISYCNGTVWARMF